MRRIESQRLSRWLVKLWRRLPGTGPLHEERPLEFGAVLDRVWEEKDWVMLRAGALERSWQAEGERSS